MINNNFYNYVDTKIPKILNSSDIKLNIYFSESDILTSGSNLQITDKGLYSISKPKDADWITKKIKESLIYDAETLTISDITAGIGGNLINFSKYFKFVFGIEYDKTHFNVLKNNINALNLKNTNIINANIYNVFNTVNSDIVFIDPPWGGKYYKDFKQFYLKLGKYPISFIINKFFNNKIKYVALKAPFNLNINILLKYVNYQNVNIYKQNHILLLVFY